MFEKWKEKREAEKALKELKSELRQTEIQMVLCDYYINRAKETEKVLPANKEYAEKLRVRIRELSQS
jgi:hypothetical protein